jgi:hypothetical protein
MPDVKFNPPWEGPPVTLGDPEFDPYKQKVIQGMALRLEDMSRWLAGIAQNDFMKVSTGLKEQAKLYQTEPEKAFRNIDWYVLPDLRSIVTNLERFKNDISYMEHDLSQLIK